MGWTKRIGVVLLVAGMCLCLLPAGKAYGYAYGEKTNTVDIYVGYFGGPYAYIQTVTEDEMRSNCEYGEWTYSSIDNGRYTRYNLAYGVTVESLLRYCNIALDSVDEIYFLGTDNGYYAGFSNLFGVPHYYFPYLAANYDQGNPDESKVSLINSNKIEVPAILAFQQSLHRDSGEFDEQKYRDMMDDDECLRIVFGQTVWNEVSTSDSVKWVYEIAVMLKGSPIITATDMEMDYGSEASPIYEVSTGFEALDELIRNDITIRSDNSNIVKYDEETGKLYALNSGSTTIYFQYGNVETAVRVAVGKDPNEGKYGGESGSDGKTPGDPPEDDEDDESGDDSDGNSDSKSNQNDTEQQDQEDSATALSQNPGSDGGAGSGGDTNGAGGTGDDGVGSGTGNADTGSGAGGGLLSDSQGGTEGDDIGGGNPFLEGTGDSTVASMGENTEASAQTVSDETSENPASAKSVYLSLGNIAGGETAGGSISGSGTTGGSGGKMLEIEELPFYYYVILIVGLAALFVGGGMYRSLRFRKDIAR